MHTSWQPASYLSLMEMESTKLFTVRAYVLMVLDNTQILIVEESFQGNPLVKFPGGGVEWGESPHQTLHRELDEELGLAISLDFKLLFTPKEAIQSAFVNNTQVVPLYYLSHFQSSDKTHNIVKNIHPKEPIKRAYWANLSEKLKNSLNLQSDKEALHYLIAHLNQH